MSHRPTEPLATARLTIEPLVPDDAGEMANVLAAPELYVFTGGGPPCADELRDRYRRWAAGPPDDGAEEWHNWVVRRRDDRVAVGWVQATVTDERRRAEVAWVIGLRWQGLGYATEAARALVAWLQAGGVMAITAHIHPGHAASAAVARRAGLRPTDEVEDGEIVWRSMPQDAGPPAARSAVRGTSPGSAAQTPRATPRGSPARADLGRGLARPRIESGRFAAGLPYNRIGRSGPPLIVFQGLFPDNRPLSGATARFILAPFVPLAARYTVYVVNRRSALPSGYTLADMADDYEQVVERELGTPIDVVGLSTGGSIAQVFAARHPALVRRLVLYSAACTLSARGRRFQRRLADLAREGRWGAVSAESFAFIVLPRSNAGRRLVRPIVSFAGRLISSLERPPDHPGDYVATIEAEDAFDSRPELGRIAAPTLVIAGARDPFYSPALFRETAAGIPDARLILYPKAGHSPMGKQVSRDILAFLTAADPSG